MKITMKRREMLTGLVFLSPWLFGITAIFLFNLFQAFRFSFYNLEIDATYGGFILHYVGLEHFHHILFVHGTFFRELMTSVLNMMVNVPLIIFFSLLMAVILNRQFMMRGAVRAIFFLPVVLATPGIVQTMQLMMAMMTGGISPIAEDVMRAQQGFSATFLIIILFDFGVPIQLIGYMMQAIAALHDVIRSSGVQILIFLAALQSIPSSMYEVAQIEGATGYETFWKVTIPMVSPLILTNVVYTIVDTYANSAVVRTAHHMAFINQNFGAGAAMHILSTLLTCTVLLLVGWSISRFVYYHN